MLRDTQFVKEAKKVFELKEKKGPPQTQWRINYASNNNLCWATDYCSGDYVT